MSEASHLKGIVLDIEGTVSPLAFVHETLFPFARDRVEDFLVRRGDEKVVAAASAEIARHAGDPSLAERGPSALAGEARRLIARDAKQAGLKELQGLIWEEGFLAGELRAPLYPDVPRALAEWSQRGLLLAVYSSGSAHAQRVFFAHTDAGDQSAYFCDWFDPTLGPKHESSSYIALAEALGCEPRELLFVSDAVAELTAARRAGFQTRQALREGVVPGDPDDHPPIESFAEILLGEEPLEPIEHAEPTGPAEHPEPAESAVNALVPSAAAALRPAQTSDAPDAPAPDASAAEIPEMQGEPTIAVTEDGSAVTILDQTILPYRVERRTLGVVAEVAEAIRTMQVRGAPLIGVTAAYGLWLALRVDAGDAALEDASAALLATRPTAVNLRWALDRMVAHLAPLPPAKRAAAALAEAEAIAAEDVATNLAIGRHGLQLLRAAAARKSSGEPVHVLTHCNAGRLGCVSWGTALAPIYLAVREGLPVHVWVDETRPRNQGAMLTTWELAESGVPHTLIADNAGGLLMREGEVDLCLVGADRVASNGDTCNKIGTYLKALAAADNEVPFYVAVPPSTVDLTLADGGEIPIEERDETEVTHQLGLDDEDLLRCFRVAPHGTQARNPAFDITPARFITAFVTEWGIVPPRELAFRHD